MPNINISVICWWAFVWFYHHCYHGLFRFFSKVCWWQDTGKNGWVDTVTFLFIINSPTCWPVFTLNRKCHSHAKARAERKSMVRNREIVSSSGLNRTSSVCALCIHGLFVTQITFVLVWRMSDPMTCTCCSISDPAKWFLWNLNQEKAFSGVRTGWHELLYILTQVCLR